MAEQRLHVNERDWAKLRGFDPPVMRIKRVEPPRSGVANIVAFWFAGEIYQERTCSMPRT
jgi:hypothetical protein